MKTCWLEAPGARIPLGARSVLVGRNPDCDVVIQDAQVSRHHAFIRATFEGAELIPMGSTPVRLNGAPCSVPTVLVHGDRVAVCDWEFRLVVEDAPAPESNLQWYVEREAGALFRVSDEGFTVGGGATDSLVIDGWEPATFALLPWADGLALEALRPGVSYGHELAEGEITRLRAGARIVHRDVRLRVIALASDPSKDTDVPNVPQQPTHAELVLLPRGGKLSLGFGSRALTVYLADRRCDLVACLLQPPAPFKVGQFVPDEVVCDEVWPRGTAGRLELNTLTFRLRKDLFKAGVDGSLLLERTSGGVRLNLAPGAKVNVRTA